MTNLTLCIESPELKSRLRAAALLMQANLFEVSLPQLLKTRKLPDHWILVDHGLHELTELIQLFRFLGKDPCAQIIRFIDEPWQTYVYHDIPIFASIVIPKDPLSTVQVLERLRKTKPLSLEPASTANNSNNQPALNPYGSELTRSPGMQVAVKQLERLRHLNVDTVLLGPTGAGKDTAAHWLHTQSGAKGQLVHINCAALPEQLFEAELFGVTAGAYTGALKDRPGKLELADQGTLYLDEIDSLALPCQAKLLGALQYRGATRLGGQHFYASDCRVIASTKVDFRTLIDKGQFREDLYFRLNVSQVNLPPLADRLEDIIPLYKALLAQHAQRYQVAVPHVDDELLDTLMSHGWPGNVRELSACAQRHVIGLDIGLAPSDSTVGRTLKERVAAFEKAVIDQALANHNGCARSAARELGLAPNALYYRIRRLEPEATVEPFPLAAHSK